MSAKMQITPANLPTKGTSSPGYERIAADTATSPWVIYWVLLIMMQ